MSSFTRWHSRPSRTVVLRGEDVVLVEAVVDAVAAAYELDTTTSDEERFRVACRRVAALLGMDYDR